MSEFQSVVPSATEYPDFYQKDAWEYSINSNQSVMHARMDDGAVVPLANRPYSHSDSLQPEDRMMRKLVSEGSLVEQSNLRGLREQIVELQNRMGSFPELQVATRSSFGQIETELQNELQRQRELQVTKVADYLARKTNLWIVTKVQNFESRSNSGVYVSLAKLESLACDPDSESVVPVVAGKSSRPSVLKRSTSPVYSANGISKFRIFESKTIAL